MTRPALIATSVIVASVLAAAGGSGRSEPAGLLWQLAALIGALLAVTAPAPRGSRALAACGVTLVAAWLTSACMAAVPHHALVEAMAWSCTLVGAAALMRASRAAGGPSLDGEARRAERDVFVSRTVLALTLAHFVTQAIAIAGWPLLGQGGTAVQVRPLGTLMDPNHLTALLILLAVANAPLAGAHARGLVHGVLAVALACGALATQGRIALVSVALLALAEAARRLSMGSMKPSRRALRWSVAGGLALALVLGLMGTRMALRRAGEQDAWTRPTIWAAVAPAALERPLLGLGAGGFREHWHAYNPPVQRGLARFEKQATTPHGEWLRLPIETGLAGAALALAMVVLAAIHLRREWRQLWPWMAAVAPLMAVHDVFHAASSALLVPLVAGLVLARHGPLEVEVDERPLASTRSAAFACLVLGAAWVAGARARVTLADVLFNRGDVAGAHRIDPADPDLPSGLARTAMSASELEEAAGWFDEAARLASHRPDLARDIARLRARTMAAGQREPGDASRLEVELLRAAALDPRDAWFRVEAVAMLHALGVPALGLIDEALQLEPAMTRALAWRVLVLRQMGRAPEADRAREALEHHIKAIEAHVAESDYEREVLFAESDLLDAARLDDTSVTGIRN